MATSGRMMEVIAAAFPGSRLRVEHGTIAGPLHHDSQFHSLRLRFEPVLEIFLDLPPLDGFELRIQWGDRWLGDTNIGEPRVDDVYLMRTNDPLLAVPLSQRVESRQAVSPAAVLAATATHRLGFIESPWPSP